MWQCLLLLLCLVFVCLQRHVSPTVNCSLTLGLVFSAMYFILLRMCCYGVDVSSVTQNANWQGVIIFSCGHKSLSFGLGWLYTSKCNWTFRWKVTEWNLILSPLITGQFCFLFFLQFITVRTLAFNLCNISDWCSSLQTEYNITCLTGNKTLVLFCCILNCWKVPICKRTNSFFRLFDIFLP